MLPPSSSVFFGVCYGLAINNGRKSGSGTIVLHPKISGWYLFFNTASILPFTCLLNNASLILYACIVLLDFSQLWYSYPPNKGSNNERIIHDWLVETKTITRVTIERVSFEPTRLHIWLLYAWWWSLLALWMVTEAVQWHSRQVPAITRVFILTTPSH